MTLSERLRRGQLTLGVLGVVVGLAALLKARGGSSVMLGWQSFELRLMSYNRLGALLTVALSAVGLAAALVRRPSLAWIPAVGFGLLALQVAVQWRTTGSNLVGSQGSNLGFALLLALGSATTAALSAPKPGDCHHVEPP